MLICTTWGLGTPDSPLCAEHLVFFLTDYILYMADGMHITHGALVSGRHL